MNIRFFGRVGVSKRNIIWSDGPKCTERKRGGGLRIKKSENMQMVVVFGN
jgi:hypothetical protein